ncbi:EamA/RhaT family transporter [Arcticibacter pallidicorallinus]|uniref:EamA/RhaT family transporter n=1 Tax=Arcticibacter pallidicorallinus TaxID=1259464 RepID=UPI001FECEF9A|nr:EamA/RhaT family transporter [Arcticibacter pallidicorallinus]
MKVAKRYDISVPQAIVWNYAAAVVLTYSLFRPEISIPQIRESPFSIYLLLGILLPSLFVILGLSVRYTGIVRTDLAQRLSLFIPLLTAFIIFKEQMSSLKILGILVGFLAIIFSIPWHKAPLGNKNTTLGWLYPLIVFVGMGIIDILFKQVASFQAIPYTSSLFIIFVLSFLLAVVGLILAIISGKTSFGFKNLICGIILGVFNFGNILFYLKAHRAIPENPSVVFSAMNIGVIIAGSVVGVFLFREKLSRLNIWGIGIAIVAIFLISA